jgi:hypothetical protein
LRTKAQALEHQGDPQAAATLFRQAAVGGDAIAQQTYGQMLLDGKTIARDEQQGRHWLREASRQHRPGATRSTSPTDNNDARGIGELGAKDSELLSLLIGLGLAGALGITGLVMYLHLRDPGPPIPGLNKLPKSPPPGSKS